MASLDGIQVNRSQGPARVFVVPKKSTVQSRKALHKTLKRNVRTFGGLLKVSGLRLRWFSGISIMLAAFLFGAFVTWQSGSTLADEATVTPPGKIFLDADHALLGPLTGLPSKDLYSMTLSQLEYYLEEGYKTPAMREDERFQKRTEKVKEYLQSKKSPLSVFAGDIAKLKHWRMVLAISNSESSLGKKCADNNCSGIGVEPGHPLWREYETKADWARDLDKLIEKRYKNWTLKKMNGVYNQPGSENWVFAAAQVLEDLKMIE